MPKPTVWLPLEMNALRKEFCPYTDEELIMLHIFRRCTPSQKRLILDYANELLNMQREKKG